MELTNVFRSCRIGFLLSLFLLQVRGLSDVCAEDATSRLERLHERWRWEMFWKSGIQRSRYTLGRRVSIELFWNNDQLGFCSLGLDSCALYTSSKSALGEMVGWSSGLRHHNLDAETQTFLRNPIRSPVVTRIPGSGPPRDSRSFETGEGRVSIPVIQPGNGRRDPGTFHKCKTDLLLQALDVPDAVQGKIVPADLGQLITTLKELSGNIPITMRGSVEFVIPYYAPSDPLVDILVKSKGNPDSIIFLIHDGERWSVGGHFDHQLSQSKIDELRPVILSAAMTTVRAP